MLLLFKFSNRTLFYPLAKSLSYIYHLDHILYKRLWSTIQSLYLITELSLNKFIYFNLPIINEL